MGMTIDEARREMISGKPYTDKFAMALVVAIDTMHKYQKIKQIAFPLQFCSTDKLNHEAIMKICEVLEDGKID